MSLQFGNEFVCFLIFLQRATATRLLRHRRIEEAVILERDDEDESVQPLNAMPF